jgi:hypothetical protein
MTTEDRIKAKIEALRTEELNWSRLAHRHGDHGALQESLRLAKEIQLLQSLLR